MGNLGSFAVSFAALALLWVTHHNYFWRVRAIDYWIVALNFCFLFVTLCYVFPLKFLANLMFRQSRIDTLAELGELFVLYSGGFTLLFATMALLYWRAAARQPEDRTDLTYRRNYFFLFAAVGLLSVLLATFNVGLRYGIPGYAYYLLGPICFGYARYHQRRKTARTEVESAEMLPKV